ncbi:MAG: YkgJ family cysteine cluster protein [Promethearchaeota archaeon]
MVPQNNNYFWYVIETFNRLMRSAIKGPDCTNLNNCDGACCSIKIDVPKVLAEEYIKRNYATKDDFIRSNVFAFELRFDNKTGKCFLFDKELNGCKVHRSGIKPPQCWIYPTNFSNPKKDLISCKKLSGWKIINPLNALKAEKLLEKYNFLCKVEAKKEIKELKKRLGNEFLLENSEILKLSIKATAPSRLGGIIDKWDSLDILLAEGFSLQMKKFCLKYNKECHHLPNSFIECMSICNIIADQLILYLQLNLPNFIKQEGADTNGEYPLFKLFKSSKILNI